MFARLRPSGPLHFFGCVTFLKIDADFSLEFKTGSQWLAVVPGAKRIIGCARHCCLKIRSAFVHDYIYIDSRNNIILQNVLGFEERMFHHTCICMRSDESS